MTAEQPGSVVGHPTIAELIDDPHPHLAALRATRPVAWVPALGAWLVTGHRLALQVLHDPQRFTVDDPRFSTAQVVGPSMLSLDGEEHRRHRQPFTASFYPRAVRHRFAQPIAARLRGLLDSITDAGARRCPDAGAALAGPLAASTIATALGLDGADERIVAELLGWYRAIVDSVAGVGEGRAVTPAGAAAMTELAAALAPSLAAGSGSLLGDAAGQGLSEAEVISNAAVIMFGAIETTEAMILNALWYLLGSEARTAGPVDVTAAVGESLRLEPAAATVDRYATEDTDLHWPGGSARILAGDPVSISLAGANRDPDVFADPDRYDLGRANLQRALAFAAGPHVCIGIYLAWLETELAVGAVLEALPGVALGPDSTAPRGLIFRKPPRLDLTWT